MGCGCKKRKPKPAAQPNRIKITEPKPVVKTSVSNVEKEIINQIATELKDQSVLS